MRTLATKQTAINQYNGLGNQLWDLSGQRPTLDLRFAEDRTLVDATTGSNLVDFTRASSGTYVGSDGLIKTATTNLLLQSEDFSTTWTNTESSENTDAIIAPDGTLTADALVDTIVASPHQFLQSVAGLTGSTAYTFSCWMKKGSKDYGVLVFSPNASWGTGSGATAFFDLVNGSVNSTSETTAAIQEFPDGWYRCTATATTVASPGTASLRVCPSESGTAQTYTGNADEAIYFWGAQLEQSSTVGEYVKTTSTINSAPRFDHDPTTGESLGLLVEESRTNLLLWSEEFNDAAWLTSASYSSISVNSEVAPDGSQTADVIDFSSGSGFFYQTVTVSASTAYTFSFFRKVTGLTKVALYDASNAAWITQEATMTTTAYPNGWDKVWVSFTTPAGCTSLRVYPERLGGGVRSITFWGAQLEAGSFPTSYIPTTSSTVTRAADVASIASIQPWFTASLTDHTFYAEARSNGTSNNATVIEGYQGTSFKGLSIVLTSKPRLLQRHGSSRFDTSGDLAGVPLGEIAKIAISTSAQSSGSVNGVQVTSVATPSQSDWTSNSGLSIGSRASGGSLYYTGTIARICYWPQRLPNETLQTITQ